MIRFCTGSYPIAGPPRLEGEVAGCNSRQLPPLNTHVLSVSEENVEVEVAPPKIYRAFASVSYAMPKCESFPGPGKSTSCQAPSFQTQNSSVTVLAYPPYRRICS